MGWFSFIDATIIFKNAPSKDVEKEIFDIFRKLSKTQIDDIVFTDRKIDGAKKRCAEIHFSFDYNRGDMLKILDRIKTIADLENGTYFEFSDMDDDTWSFTYKNGTYIEEGN